MKDMTPLKRLPALQLISPCCCSSKVGTHPLSVQNSYKLTRKHQAIETGWGSAKPVRRSKSIFWTSINVCLPHSYSSLFTHPLCAVRHMKCQEWNKTKIQIIRYFLTSHFAHCSKNTAWGTLWCSSVFPALKEAPSPVWGPRGGHSTAGALTRAEQRGTIPSLPCSGCSPGHVWFLGWQSTRLGHVQPPTHQQPKAPQGCSSPFPVQPGFVLGTAPSQGQDLELGLAELPGFHPGPLPPKPNTLYSTRLIL